MSRDEIFQGDKAVHFLTVLTLAQWEGDHERAEEDEAEGEGLQEGRGGATRQERYRGLSGQRQGNQADHEVVVLALIR